MFKRIEAFFAKEFSEKAGRLFVFSIFLFVPNFQFKMLFLFLLATSMLAWDIQQKRTVNLMILPFSLSQVFLLSWGFMISLITITHFIGAAIPVGLLTTGYFVQSWLNSLIFATSYFSIAMIFVISGLDNLGMPFLVLIGDWILSSIGGFRNFYWYISPVSQGNVLASATFAFVLFALALYMFVKKGATK
ncbi:MAG TPA: hypothetical protein PK466_01655 [Thermotogota bacterium]|nr:hypothetical protein [Thermotogota bacterium]HPJ87912.1 hypothetical protein [Thermotogota bacterium]HPR95005.1 hypothetical protein [Thermotogota bacterium]